jgi:hypothetical protein
VSLGWYLVVAIGGALAVMLVAGLIGCGPLLSLVYAVAWALIWKLIGPLVVDRSDWRYWDGRK